MTRANFKSLPFTVREFLEQTNIHMYVMFYITDGDIYVEFKKDKKRKTGQIKFNEQKHIAKDKKLSQKNCNIVWSSKLSNCSQPITQIAKKINSHHLSHTTRFMETVVLLMSYYFIRISPRQEAIPLGLFLLNCLS